LACRRGGAWRSSSGGRGVRELIACFRPVFFGRHPLDRSAKRFSLRKSRLSLCAGRRFFEPALLRQAEQHWVSLGPRSVDRGDYRPGSWMRLVSCFLAGGVGASYGQGCGEPGRYAARSASLWRLLRRMCGRGGCGSGLPSPRPGRSGWSGRLRAVGSGFGGFGQVDSGAEPSESPPYRPEQQRQEVRAGMRLQAGIRSAE